MITHIDLPFDPAGYGDFSAAFENTNLRICFEYRAAGRELIGQIDFDFCIDYRVSGMLTEHAQIGYDCIYEIDDVEYGGWQYKRYQFMLSGSDFQFTVTARNCTFSEVGSGRLNGSGS